MVDIIQSMAHRVRTAYGDSNLTYGGYTVPKEFNHFIMGIFQGNGCKPQLCSIISSIVFSTLCNQGFSIHFVNSFTTEISELLGFSYVDDCNIIQLDEDMEFTHSKIQLSISEWGDLIRIMGGCLAPGKSAWCLFDHGWIRGKWKCTNLGKIKY